MAKGEAKPLMSPAEMKPLLLLSKKQPVNCAIGLTKDKMGVILLDKKAKPQKVLAQMKKQAKAADMDLDASSCRFGRAMVDTDTDSSLVQFAVNKDAPGAMRPKLIELLKKAGFGKCEIYVESGLDAADEGDDDSEQADDPAEAAPAAAGGAEAAAPAGGAADDAEAQAAAPAAEAASEAAPAAAPVAGPAPEAPQQGAGAPDAGAITKRLTGLVKRMMAALSGNPGGADAMKTAAMAGQAALKSGDLATANDSCDTLERMLDAMSGGGQAPGAAAAAGATPAPGAAAGDAPTPKNGPGSPVFGKARATWVATRKKVESEIEKLHDELQKTYKGQGVVADLEKTFRSKVEPMMGKFDESLSDKLDEISKTTDGGDHAKLVQEAQQIITNYEQMLGSDPLISQLDSNPFVPLAIGKTLTASLGALSKTVA